MYIDVLEKCATLLDHPVYPKNIIGMVVWPFFSFQTMA